MNKILLITQDYFPNQGGVARYYKRLVSKLGNRVSVLTSVPGPEEANVFRRNYFSQLWPAWWPLIKIIPDYYWKTQSKILWAGDLLPVGTVCWFLKMIYKWPYIVSVHGLDVQLAKTHLVKKYLSKIILHNAKFVICNSEFTAGLVKDITDANTVVIHPEPELIPPADEELINRLRRMEQLKGKKVVFSMARLVKRKGIDEVIQAIDTLVKKHSDFVYIIAGTGPEESRLKSLAQGLPIIFLGAVGDEEAKAYFAISDIFVLTPQDNKIDVEGFGIVFTEAAMFGKPIVGRAVGGVKEAVGDNALWVNNVDDLVLALERLLSNNELCTRLGNSAKDYVQKQIENNKVDLINKIFNI